MSFIKYFILSALAFLSLNANSSCYEIYKTEVKADTKINKAIFVLIDETTFFNDSLQDQILKNSIKHIEAGNYIYIAKFSAFIGNHYNEKVFDFKLDKPLDEKQRYNERKDSLKKIDKCLKDQVGFAKVQTIENIKKSFLKPNENIEKSDIFYALDDFGKNVISRVEADEKIVILASDLLENSTISSFYSKGTTRIIDSKKEIQIVEKNNLISDFGGAALYVVGTGIVTGKNSTTYRDPKILISLKNFWEEYFKKSNANLVELGQPALKNEIK